MQQECTTHSEKINNLIVFLARIFEEKRISAREGKVGEGINKKEHLLNIITLRYPFL